MKTLNKLLLALAATAALSAPVQADSIYGALRDGTAGRTAAGLISHHPPAGTTDALRYTPRKKVGPLHEVTHQAPAGTTDQARELAERRGAMDRKALAWVE